MTRSQHDVEARVIHACPRVAPAPGDDAGFLSSVDRLVAGMVVRFHPQRIALVRVLRWFDHRWLRAAADRLAFPAFAPSRIAAEHHWTRRPDGCYAVAADAAAVHRRKHHRRADDRHRRVLGFTSSGLFVWYSSDTIEHQRGSLMSYVVCDHRALPWFVNLVPGPRRWQAAVVKGLDLDDVADLLTHPLAVHTWLAPVPVR